MSTSRYFDIASYKASGNLCRITALASNYQAVVADSDFVYGRTVNDPKCLAYVKDGTVRTYALYVFAKQSSSFSNMPPSTLHATDNPWSYIYAVGGQYGTLTYNNETYAYAIWKAFLYDESTQEYYAYYYNGGSTEVASSNPLIDFAFSVGGQSVVFSEKGQIGDSSTGTSELFTVETATSCLEFLLNGSSGSGQGTVVLDIPANGMNLTFTSALQGISNDKFVTGDTEITITPTKKNVDITISSLVGDVVTIKDRYGNVKATVNITAQ